MKKLFYLVSILVAGALAVSCEPEPQGGNDNLTASFSFTLKVTEANVDYAKVSVKHNGPEDATWYGFVAEDTKSTNDLIMEKYTEFLKAGSVKDLQKSKNRTVTLRNLKSNTKYKYIVFAITENAELYSNVDSKSVAFSTVGFLLSQTDDWKVTRSEQRENNQEKYSVEFGSNAARCHIAFFDKKLVDNISEQEEVKEEIDTYGGLRLQLGEDGQIFLFSVLDYLVFDELYEYWGYYDSDKNYFEQESFKENSAFFLPRQSSGDYYAVAIGFDDNGVPTFEYSSTLVTIKPETASQEYKNWLGEWTLTGENKISYNLKLEEGDPNFTYYVYGWECSKSVHNNSCDIECTDHMVYTDFSEYELGIPFYFDALNGELNVNSLLIGAEQDSNGGNLYWGLYGQTEYMEENLAILLDNDKIASAAQTADGQTTLNGLDSKAELYDQEGNTTVVNFKYNSLGYVMYDEQTFTPQAWNIPMGLPATLVKVEDTPEPAAFKMKKAGAAKEHELAKARYNSIRKADYSRFAK